MAAADPAPASTPQLRRWARVRAVPALARVAWTDVVAFIGATAAMLPLLPRRRPLGREPAAPYADAPPRPDRQASEG